MRLFLLYISMVFVSFYFGYLTWKELQPFETSKITAVVPTDKKVYHPGEAIGFKLDLCIDGFKWDEATYQLESEENKGNFYSKVLGSYKSIGRPGCFKLTDLK